MHYFRKTPQALNQADVKSGSSSISRCPCDGSLSPLLACTKSFRKVVTLLKFPKVFSGLVPLTGTQAFFSPDRFMWHINSVHFSLPVSSVPNIAGVPLFFNLKSISLLLKSYSCYFLELNASSAVVKTDGF